MLTLITGASKCGKSTIAEEILARSDLKKYYIATMEPFCSDAFEAIERHQKMRLGKGFVSIEKYTDIHELAFEKGSAVLLECACNLLANEMFGKKEKNPVEKIIKGIEQLNLHCSELIIVTNQVGEDGGDYSDDTPIYIENLGLLNFMLASRADCVIEAVFGIPVYLKGEV